MPLRQLIAWWVLFTTIGVIIGAILFGNSNFTIENIFTLKFGSMAEIILAITAICALMIARRELKNNEEKILAESITFYFEETNHIEDKVCMLSFCIKNTSKTHYIIEKPILNRAFKECRLTIYKSDTASTPMQEWTLNTSNSPYKKETLTIFPNSKISHSVLLTFSLERPLNTSDLKKIIEENYLLIRPTYKNSKDLTKLRFNLPLDWEEHAETLRARSTVKKNF